MRRKDRVEFFNINFLFSWFFIKFFVLFLTSTSDYTVNILPIERSINIWFGIFDSDNKKRKIMIGKKTKRKRKKNLCLNYFRLEFLYSFVYIVQYSNIRLSNGLKFHSQIKLSPVDLFYAHNWIYTRKSSIINHQIFRQFFRSCFMLFYYLFATIYCDDD